MELLRLVSDPGSTDFLQPDRVIENYESLIWSERYHPAGDFQIVSSDVKRTMGLLPLEGYVTLRESTVPMVIESYKIESVKGKAPKLTVNGRTFETVLERRGSVNTLDLTSTNARLPWSIFADKISDAAYKAIREVIGDIARSNLPAAVLEASRSGDVIPEINLPLPSDYTTGTSKEYPIRSGNLYAVILEMLETNHHGIRAVRPTTPGKNTIDLDIYNGADLRETAVFDAKFDQFDNATYLLSNQGSMNLAYIYGPNGASIRQKNNGPEVTGLKRRVLVVDGTNEDTLNSDANRQARGLIELYNNNATALFDGETSAQIAELYNKPVNDGGYGLGDILKLRGEYNLDRDVRVAEFIRSSDSSGESAYPAFQVIDE